jgi:TRAP-type C4-dicarboxylate transport system permease small subunit
MSGPAHSVIHRQRFGNGVERVATALDTVLVRSTELALATTLGACVIAALAQAVARYTPWLPIYVAWPDEMARAMMAWMTFLGAALLVHEDGHIRIELPPTWLGGARGMLVRSLVADVGLVAGVGVVGWSALQLVVSDASAQMVTMPISLALMSGSILVGALLQLYFGLRKMVSDVEAIRGRWLAD